MNKTALVISAVLTAFLLAVTAGVVYTVRGAQQVKAQEVQAQDVQTQDVQTQGAQTQEVKTLDSQLQQEIQQREANYQNLIAQANERLLQAQKTQQELQSQLAALQNTASNSIQEIEQLAIDPEQAALIAAQYLGQSSIYSVETSLLYGATVYKVTFSSGDIAYVNMSGDLIGVQPAPAAQPKLIAARHSDRNGHSEGENEGGDD